MKVNRSYSLFPTLVVAMTSLLPAVVLAGPETVAVTRTDVRQQTVEPLHKRLAERLLVACGLEQPAPIYVPPGYLELSGPSGMMVYHRPPPLPRRHFAPSTESDDKPTATAAAPAASPAPLAAPVSLPSPAPALPAPALPAPDSESGLLPETGGGNPVGQNHTEEMLSYFQRQRPGPHAAVGPLQPSGGQGPNDPGEEPSFLQVPQAPEQPVLPPSRATYRITP